MTKMMGHKNNAQYLFFLLLVLLIFYPYSYSTSYINFNDTSENNPEFATISSSSYELIGPIIIDDLDSARNWSKTASQNDWCTGSGTLIDPYVVEGISISGGASDECLEILNSDCYFIIRNCVFFLSGGEMGEFGVKLSYSSNGILSNNLFLPNFHKNLYLYQSNNIEVSENSFNGNSYGIWLKNSNFNTITKNTLTNYLDAIFFETASNNNNVTDNILNNIEQTGIFITGMNNIFKRNIMDKGGINIGGSLSEKTSIDFDTSNLINSKPIYYFANKKGLTPGDFLNASQIRLVNCTDSIISDVSISNAVHGISLDHCNNITVKNSVLSYNLVIGIVLKAGSSNNTILNNKVRSNTDYGIYIYNIETSNNLIYLNEFSSNRENALDYGSNNRWDNGSIGNSWDDYSGCDLNNDGIGDVAYQIKSSFGSKDFFPIWKNGSTIYSIYLDDQETGVGARTWAWLSMADWCTGIGTFNDPYIIDGLILTGDHVASRFEIRNSRKYFIIRNCILTDCGGGAGNRAGIKLVNTTNGKIQNNEIKDNRANGIYLIECSNITIKDNYLNNNLIFGICLENSNNNIISYNTIYGDIQVSASSYNQFTANSIINTIRGRNGLTLYDVCRYNVIEGNQFKDCSLIFLVFYSPISIFDLSSNNISPSNLINGNPLYVYSGVNNLNHLNFIQAGQIILINCQNCIIPDLHFSNNDRSISLYFCINITIRDNVIDSSSRDAIYLYQSSNNVLLNNIISSTYSNGITLFYSCNNDILNNNVQFNGNTGIYIGIGSDTNYIYNNIVSNNGNNGMYFYCADNNIISKNVFQTNGDKGIHFQDSSSHNLIYLNEFYNNPTQASTVQSTNHWDNGLIGNYWSDYSGLDLNHDGIGDIPYVISVGSQDNFPIWRVTLYRSSIFQFISIYLQQSILFGFLLCIVLVTNRIIKRNRVYHSKL